MCCEDAYSPNLFCGVDIIEISRIRRALERNSRFAEKVFHDSELAYAGQRRDPVPFLAARFCAKEAVMKLLGQGIGSVGFKEIVVEKAAGGKPVLMLLGNAKASAQSKGICQIELSLSHSDTMAIATAVATKCVDHRQF